MTNKILIDKAVLQQALDALVTISQDPDVGRASWDYAECGNACFALREALAAPQPTPATITPSELAARIAAGEQWAVATIRYEHKTSGKENDMPKVVSCDWLPDGEYKVYLAPQPQPAQESATIYQFRSPHCADWYDGVPDHHDGHGPYEVRTLYTVPQPQRQPLTEAEVITLWAGDTPRPVLGRNKVLAFARAIEIAHRITGEAK